MITACFFSRIITFPLLIQSGASSAECNVCKRFVIDATDGNSTTFNDCVAQCPALTFVESLTRRCLPCSSQCRGSCTGPLPTQCLACRYVTLGSTCVSECPPGSYADALAVCKPCNTQCKDTCTGPTTQQCDVCLNFNNTLLNQCVPACPTTMYADEYNNCYSCNAECFGGCYGSGPGQCLTVCSEAGCLPACRHAVQATPEGRVCVSRCNNQSYLDASNQCRACDPVCDGCTGPGTLACTRCTQHLYQGACTATCPISTYPDTPSTCALCDGECQQGCIAAGPQSCTRCLHVNNSGICQYSCPQFTYLQNNNCQICNSQCANGCIGPGPSECTNGICKAFSFLSKCVADCPAGTLARGGVCESCPFGIYFLDATGNCSQCNPECSGGCSGPGASECLSPCAHVAVIQDNVEASGTGSVELGVTVCVASCPPMTYLGFDKICRSCNPLCSIGCSGPTTSMCTSCRDHYYQGQCMTNCPVGTHGADGIDCVSCDAQCLSCTGNGPLQCKACLRTRDPVLGCVASCAIDKWTVSVNNETACVPCNAVPGLVLSNNICTNSCPAGAYIDSNSVCQLCDSQCAVGTACSGAGPANCTICKSAKLDGVCMTLCPASMFLNSYGVCQACHTQCLASSGCSGPSASDCNECSVYTYPVGAPLGTACKSGQICGRCVSECPGVLTRGTCALSCEPFEYAAPNSTCFACDTQCATGCSSAGPGGCTSGLCRSNKLLSGQCVIDCPAKFVPIQAVCQPCDSHCLFGCIALGPAACTNGSCVGPSSASGVCVSQCPLGQYWRGTPNSACQGSMKLQ
jgi:proprotein convertase subtilisin/kexin type 5